MKNKPFFEEKTFTHQINYDNISGWLYGIEDTPAELKAFLEDNLDCISSLKGLLNKEKWEGLALLVEPSVAENQFSIGLGIRKQGSYDFTPWTRVLLTPNGEYWRVRRWEGERTPNGWANCDPQETGVLINKSDIKVFLGKLKTELRKRH